MSANRDLAERMAAPVSMAVAATTDLCAALSSRVHLTGQAIITSLGAPARSGIERDVLVLDVMTFVHSATMLLPGARNINAGPGAILRFVSHNGGWRCFNYEPAEGNTTLGLAIGAILGDGVGY
jgi:hypothetical protein